ncbi:hypothetical protein CORC01_02224 [Colletotrichum orchidophilum]|uniref:Methyltransferase domain-containing protein n=1 Tax=Colletotrichum orchidophilum TaxID=1209926 RepID=A0A1G4BM42_9PEZI|nr:uncharacterized protein CORC01_02224 [Colletotrichum orchidophilum]OHF02529.1 hypothetical protein CORC01_02224 [Colletotrichum orchidophilum]
MADSTPKAAASPPAGSPKSPKSPKSPQSVASPAAPASAAATAATPTPQSPPTEAAETPATIEIDDGSTDDASTIDDRISSYTASLTSSVVDYPTEYGRRYHAFRSGVKTIGDRLFLAPIDAAKTHRILDVGTGTGIWAIEMGDLFPNAEILGNDLSAIQPPWVPPNVKFEIDDVESEWIGHNKYDFIFSRYMAGALADWPTYMRRVYENLNPGGWAEFQDWDYMLYSDDGTTEGTELLKWMGYFMDACEALGRDGQVGPKLETLVRENTGLINIVHKPFKIPAGPWAKDAHLKDIGMCNLIQMLDGLEAFTLRLLCGVLGWTKEEVLVLLTGVRNELRTGKAHAWLHYNVVYGQKPKEEEN